MKCLLFVLVVLVGGVLLPPRGRAEVADVSTGASGGFVDVTAANAGIRVGPKEIRTALRIRVKAAGATDVCFSYVDRDADCATALVDPDNAGICRAPNEAYVFMVSDEHWRGQVCAILKDGVVAVRVPYNAW